ncbi:MAG: flavin reductase [Clostridia bacterium]|nr:flavin reductase [Clostridia bacterium]
MRRAIEVFDHADTIVKALPEGILLNTYAGKFNSMVIGWGHLGVIWGLPTFTVYVRQSRFTKSQLDATREFTVSVPLDGVLDREVFHICGTQSGRDIDKERDAHLTLVDAVHIRTPAVREAPLTLECKVLYQQDQVLDRIPQDLAQRYYGRAADVGDFHTAYIGQILDAYIIE